MERIAARLIVEEALEAESRDALGREYYEHGAAPGQGCRNGVRTGRLKTAEGLIQYHFGPDGLCVSVAGHGSPTPLSLPRIAQRILTQHDDFLDCCFVDLHHLAIDRHINLVEINARAQQVAVGIAAVPEDLVPAGMSLAAVQ